MIVVPDFTAILQERRDKWPWLDHTVRAAQRYQAQNGDYYAAGMTYFSVLALFPLLMVAFAVAGFVLVGHPEWLNSISTQVTESIPGSTPSSIRWSTDGSSSKGEVVPSRWSNTGSARARIVRSILSWWVRRARLDAAMVPTWLPRMLSRLA